MTDTEESNEPAWFGPAPVADDELKQFIGRWLDDARRHASEVEASVEAEAEHRAGRSS